LPSFATARAREEDSVMDWESKDVGTKDLIIAFGILGSMAAVAIIILLIASLT
jgi:hypothetical protein